MDCASDQLLHDFADRALEAPESAEVREHLIACHQCRRRFAGVRAQVEAFRTLRQGAVRSADEELLRDESWFEHLRQACVAEMKVADMQVAETRAGVSGVRELRDAPPRPFVPAWAQRWAPVAAALLIGLGLGLWSRPGVPTRSPDNEPSAPAAQRSERVLPVSDSAPSFRDELLFPIERTRVVRMDIERAVSTQPGGSFGLGSRPLSHLLEELRSGSLASDATSGEPSDPETPDPNPTNPQRR